MACRKYAAEYVATHLHGLAVVADLTAVASATASSTATTTTTKTTTPPLVIATHNGSFHCDEALACGLLRHTAAYRAASIVRTRDPAQIAQCAIVVDVGAVYDPEAKRFDHHQSSFHGTMETPRKTYQTRLSSAGLIYKHFGREIIRDYVHAVLHAPQAKDSARAMMRCDPAEDSAATLSEKDLDTLFDAVYKNFVEQVDGIDNGVDVFGLQDPKEGKLVRRYTQSTTLSDRVGKLQTWWNEAGNGDAAVENALFVEAVELASREFFEAVTYFALAWLPARALVEAAFETGKELHPSGSIIVFKQAYCPWKDHLFAIEKQRNCEGTVLYVIFSDGKGGWRVQAVPKESSGFENRRSLPYKGLRDEELSAASGIPGGVFVHVSGFIGGMKTYDAAVQLAIKALTTD